MKPKVTIKILKESIERLVSQFCQKYGDKEVEFIGRLMTIRDDYPSTFCSGSNGYLTEVRVKDGHFEFYHDWWCYGWLTLDEVKEEYPQVMRGLEYELVRLIL